MNNTTAGKVADTLVPDTEEAISYPKPRKLHQNTLTKKGLPKFKQPQRYNKIEELGLETQCVENRLKGLSLARNARLLSELVDAEVTADNAASFFKRLDGHIEKNQMLNEKILTVMKKSSLKILGNWDFMDGELEALLKEAKKLQERCVGVDKETGEPIIIKYKDLKLLNSIYSNISKIEESRAKIALGQLGSSGTNQIFLTQITQIKNQYNDLKSLLLEAESEFPGIQEWVEQKLYKAKN